MQDKPTDVQAQPLRAAAPIEIIIGIDYGTRFTKVAVGREGQEPSVWRASNAGPLIPSIVHITTSGHVFPWPYHAPAGAVKIEYLKMLLANPTDSIFELPAAALTGQERGCVIRALAALFLSEVIRRVQTTEREKPHLRNANIRWLVNVGVPVEHFDAPERETFREVATVAFAWAGSPPPGCDIPTLTEGYRQQAAGIDVDSSPASVFPELAAALAEYISDPNRPEGHYGFCDIGGGTIDGAVFRLHRTSRGPRLAILSASVAPYGTAAVAWGVVGKLDGKRHVAVAAELPARIEGLLTDRQVPALPGLEFAVAALRTHGAEPRNAVQNFVRRFVNEARMKRNVNGYTFADPFTDKEIELRFFLAGGGAESGWYRAAIQSLNPKDNQAFYGVKRVRLETVKRSSGFRGGDFARFVIALGLTNSPDQLEGASQLLPSRIAKKPPPLERDPVQLVTKDYM